MEGKRDNYIRKSILVIVMLVIVSLWINGEIVEAQSGAQCREERRILVKACRSVVSRRPPSPYCCERIRVTNVNCVCPVITPQIAALVDVNYAIRVVQGCGRPVPRRFRCGSITTP